MDQHIFSDPKRWRLVVSLFVRFFVGKLFICLAGFKYFRFYKVGCCLLHL